MSHMLEMFQKEVMEMDERLRGIGWLVIDDYKSRCVPSMSPIALVVECRPHNLDDDDMSSITNPTSSSY